VNNGMSAVAEQFTDAAQQRDAARLGMWVFLATEVLFFGGLFAAYLVGRVLYPGAFAEASRHTDVLIGSVNTVLLLTSSLCMSLAVRAITGGIPRAAVWWMAATLVLGVAFLGLKGLEYAGDFHKHLVPALNFRFAGSDAPAAQLFFILYFLMTGLHAIHLTVGVGLVAVLLIMSARGRFSADYYTPVELGGLYWHFVDIVWIFLYPLLYLVARS
jgi:cytochrome c oxidase subunit 3